MKQIAILALYILLCGQIWAAEDSADPKEVAAEVIATMQARKLDELKLHIIEDITALEKGKVEYPNDPRIFYALGACYIVQEQIAPGLSALQQAHTLAPDDAQIANVYVLALKMNKQPLQAFELLKETAELRPDFIPLQVELAAMAIAIQKYDVADKILEGLQRKEPADIAPIDKSMILYLIGTCLLYEGDVSAATQDFESALSMTPGLGVALTPLGRAYIMAGDNVKAANVLDKALAINPKLAAALYYRGIVYEDMGTSKTAKIMFHEAYDNGKASLQDNGEDYFLMSLICPKLSKNAEAENYKKEAAQLLFTHDVPSKPKQ